VKARFKSELDARGLKGDVRANSAGCLDACERGISVVIFSDGQPPVWYQRVTEGDVKEIVDEHIVQGRAVARLRMEPYRR
jgi:(2Fe-2S) ferredoxin